MQAAYEADHDQVKTFSQKLGQVLRMEVNSLVGVYKGRCFAPFGSSTDALKSPPTLNGDSKEDS